MLEKDETVTATLPRDKKLGRVAPVDDRHLPPPQITMGAITDGGCHVDNFF